MLAFLIEEKYCSPAKDKSDDVMMMTSCTRAPVRYGGNHQGLRVLVADGLPRREVTLYPETRGEKHAFIDSFLKCSETREKKWKAWAVLR